MGNYSNEQHLSVNIFDKDSIDETTLVEIFDLDSDFLENKEYFRTKTIRAGMTESEMCAKEIYNKHKKIESPFERLKAMISTAINYDNGMQMFIVGNINYCQSYDYQVNEIGDKLIVSIAYVL